MITDLYVDYYKLKAINVKSKVPQLLNILEKSNLAELIEFFLPKKINDSQTAV